MQASPNAGALKKDQDSKAKMEACADLRRHAKPHNLNTGDLTLVKQRRHNKASPRFEPFPYTIRDDKGSMITARRATYQKEVTRNSSHLKKLRDLPESTIIRI